MSRYKPVKPVKPTNFSKILPTIDLPPLHDADLSVTVYHVDPTMHDTAVVPFMCLTFNHTTVVDPCSYHYTSTTVSLTVPYYSHNDLYGVVKGAIDYLNKDNPRANKEYANMVVSMLRFHHIGYQSDNTAVSIPAHD